MKKLIITMTMLSRTTYIVSANADLWGLLMKGDEFAIEGTPNGKLFIFQTEVIPEHVLVNISGTYHIVTGRQLNVSDEYSMFIYVQQVKDPRGKQAQKGN